MRDSYQLSAISYQLSVISWQTGDSFSFRERALFTDTTHCDFSHEIHLSGIIFNPLKRLFVLQFSLEWFLKRHA